MAPLKWLYSYRMLTARLRDGVPPSATRTAGFVSEPDVSQPRQGSVNHEPSEGKSAKTALVLAAGAKEM